MADNRKYLPIMRRTVKEPSRHDRGHPHASIRTSRPEQVGITIRRREPGPDSDIPLTCSIVCVLPGAQVSTAEYDSATRSLRVVVRLRLIIGFWQPETSLDSPPAP